MNLRLDADRTLRPVTSSDLNELHVLICANREHLGSWMPWAAKPERDATAAFLSAAQQQASRDDGVHCAILQSRRIVGVVGFHHVDRVHLAASLGYWLAADAQGRGTMTLAVGALVDHAFGVWGIHRVEIKAAVDNARSRAVAARLGFVQEGVLREAERFEDRFADLAVYSVLAHEWAALRDGSGF